MDRLERVELGKKLYVTGFMVVLWADMVLTIVRNGLHFSWASVALGLITVPVLLILGNWLHTGNRTAWRATLAFIGIQLVLALVAFFDKVPALKNLNDQVGTVCKSLAAVKLLLYGGWGAMLLFSPGVKAFLNQQRGEHPEEEEVKITPTGTVVALSGEQIESVGALARLMQVAAIVTLGAGAFQLFDAFRLLGLSGGRITGLLQTVEGVVMFALGVYLLTPATSLKKLGVEGADMAYFTHALESLAVFFRRQLVLVLIVSVALVIGIVVRLLF